MRPPEKSSPPSLWKINSSPQKKNQTILIKLFIHFLCYDNLSWLFIFLTTRCGGKLNFLVTGCHRNPDRQLSYIQTHTGQFLYNLRLHPPKSFYHLKWASNLWDYIQKHGSTSIFPLFYLWSTKFISPIDMDRSSNCVVTFTHSSQINESDSSYMTWEFRFKLLIH